jgi:hypothetical protein
VNVTFSSQQVGSYMPFTISSHAMPSLTMTIFLPLHSQVISGLSSASYYSDQGRYSLTLRSTIASCMVGLTASNVAIVNVSDILGPSSRRRLGVAVVVSAATVPSPEGIVSTYTVSAASQHSVSDLQSQLAASTANGLFNKQLTSFAQKFNAAAFVNATSTALIILTTAPTQAPSVTTKFRKPSSSDNGLGAGPIAGLVIMSVVVAALLCAGGYFYFFKHLTMEVIIHMMSPSPSWSAMDSPRSQGEGRVLEMLEDSSAIDSDDIIYQEDIVTVEGNGN